MEKLSARLNPVLHSEKKLLQLEDTQHGFLLVTLGVLIPSEDLSVYKIQCVPHNIHDAGSNGW